MQNKQSKPTFQKIMEEDNVLLEAAASSLSLQLRLIVTESPNAKNTYIGEINNLDEHEKLKETCDTFEEVLDLMKDPKNVKLNLEDKSVTLLSHLGSEKIVNILKVILTKIVKEENQFSQLEHLIDRCNSKETFESEQIKTNFGILVNEIMIMKKELYDKNKMENIKENLREQIYHIMEEFIQKKMNVMENRFIKVEEMIIKVNEQQKHENHKENKEQSVDLEARIQKSESYYESQIKRIDGEVKQLSEMLNEKMKEANNYEKQGKSMFEKSNMQTNSNPFSYSNSYNKEIKSQTTNPYSNPYQSSFQKNQNKSEDINKFSNTNFEKISTKNSDSNFSSSNQTAGAEPFYDNQNSKNKEKSNAYYSYSVKNPNDSFSKGSSNYTNKNPFSKGPQNNFDSQKAIQKTNENLNIFKQGNAPNQFQLQFYKQQKHANKFKFDGKTLQLIQVNQNPFQYYQFIFYEFIPFDKQFIFKVKIVKSYIKSIFIGVVDYDQHKQQQKFSFKSNNLVCQIGYKYPQTAEVRVDRKNKTIRWMVNNEQKASHVYEMLGEKNRKLMPYVQMNQIGDTIEYSL